MAITLRPVCNLGAEHRDVVQVGSDLQQLFQRAHAGHAVADHHEAGLLHGVHSNRAREIKGIGRGRWPPRGWRLFRQS
jgi:hypothetical protein